MKTRIGWRKHRRAAQVSMFLITAALVAAMVSCGATEYEVTFSSTDGGSVTAPGEGTFYYQFCTEVSLLATPDSGYWFVGWSGGGAPIAEVTSASTIITSVEADYSIKANFEIAPGQFGLTTSSTAGGSVTVPGEGTFIYDDGKSVGLVATPASGYQFVNWSGDVGTIANVNAASTTIAMNGNYSITANFEAIPPGQFGLTISSTAGGSVTAPGEGVFTRDEGAVVSLVATPATGYQFVNWTGNVGTIANVNAASTTITMNDNYSVTANFETISPGQYSLTISSTAGGSVTTPGEGSFARDAGTVVSLVATPATGYEFVNWTGSVGTVGNTNAASTTITMNGDYSIMANFESLAEVNIPDPNLETAIREAIDKPTGPIYASDLAVLTLLDANSRNIADLTGLEYCTSLAYLYLVDNQITSISPLANLTSLTELLLGENQISSISPLANLTNLRKLGLWKNPISNISPLTNLINLEWLLFGDNQISNISPLANLTKLTRLELWTNQISDISPLVDNMGLGAGDYVHLKWNPLSSDSINTYIPQLQARGVTVVY